MRHIILILCLGLAGCASMISGSTKTVNVTSTPDNASFVIKNKLGKVVYKGVTPSTVTLKTGNGYFEGSDYDIYYFYPNYIDKTVSENSKLNLWYLLNLALPVTGVVVGMCIVDPITGAMWTLSENVDATLQPLPNNLITK